MSEDKQREVTEGYDGTWVAHPDLVKIAKDTFVKGLEGQANQVGKDMREILIYQNLLESVKNNPLSALALDP